MVTLVRKSTANRRGFSLRRLIAGAVACTRSRKDLAQLDRRLLDDLGLTEEDVRREQARPPWDVPDWWR